jgi:hypothetical protein
MSVRSCLYALVFPLAGAFLFIFVMLCSIAFLAARNCGPAFGCFGCEAPTANIGKEGHQVALPQRSRPRGRKFSRTVHGTRIASPSF